MPIQTLFREKALARRSRRETLDARLQVTAPHEWLFVSGLAAALIVLLAFGLLGRAERSLSIETVLVRPGERVDVVAGVSGVVIDVLPKVGDTVAPGQPIARIRTPEALRLDAVVDRLHESLENANDPRDQAAVEGLRALGARLSETGRWPADHPTTQDVLTPQGGEIVALALAVGQRVGAGELAARIRAEPGGPVEALGFVTGDEAQRIAPGMQAQVLLHVASAGAPRNLRARVEEVFPRFVAPPPWLADFGLERPPHAHLLRATVTDEEVPPVVDGAGGVLRIVLGHRSFASLVFGNDGAR